MSDWLYRDAIAGLTRSGDRSGHAPTWPEIAVFRLVASHRSRHRRVLLPFEAIADAIARSSES